MDEWMRRWRWVCEEFKKKIKMGKRKGRKVEEKVT